MDGHDPAGKESKVLSLEQQRKFQELRERRLKLQKAQDIIRSGKKKRKRKNKGNKPPAAEDSEGSEKKEASKEERPISLPKFGNEQRHFFAGDASKTPAGSSEGNLETSKTPEAPLPDTPASRRKERRKLAWGMGVKNMWERKSAM